MTRPKRGGMRREGNRAKGGMGEENARIIDRIARKIPIEFCNSCGALLDLGTGPCPKCGTEEPR